MLLVVPPTNGTTPVAASSHTHLGRQHKPGADRLECKCIFINIPTFCSGLKGKVRETVRRLVMS